MNSIGRGDAIECVRGYDDGPELVVGRIYTCEDVRGVDPAYSCAMHGDGGCFGVRTVSPTLPEKLYWCGLRFKPVFKFREGQFDHLMIDNYTCEEV